MSQRLLPEPSVMWVPLTLTMTPLHPPPWAAVHSPSLLVFLEEGESRRMSGLLCMADTNFLSVSGPCVRSGGWQHRLAPSLHYSFVIVITVVWTISTLVRVCVCILTDAMGTEDLCKIFLMFLLFIDVRRKDIALLYLHVISWHANACATPSPCEVQRIFI